MQIINYYLLIILSMLPCYAEASCLANKWTESSIEVEKLTVRDFMAIDRAQLYGNLYYELTHKKSVRIPGLSEKLFHYLINTENNEAKYKVLQSIEWAAELDKEEPTIFSLKELCNLDKKASAYKGLPEDERTK